MRFNVFISSSMRDIEIIRDLKATFERYGITVVLPSEIISAAPIYQSIREQIQASDCFLVIIGEGGERSNAVNFELGIAVALNKPIVPIVEKDAILPSELRNMRYIVIDKNEPRISYERAAQYLSQLKLEKEQRNSIGGLIMLGLGLLLLGAIFGSD